MCWLIESSMNMLSGSSGFAVYRLSAFQGYVAVSGFTFIPNNAILLKLNKLQETTFESKTWLEIVILPPSLGLSGT